MVKPSLPRCWPNRKCQVAAIRYPTQDPATRLLLSLRSSEDRHASIPMTVVQRIDLRFSNQDTDPISRPRFQNRMRHASIGFCLNQYGCSRSSPPCISVEAPDIGHISAKLKLGCEQRQARGRDAPKGRSDILQSFGNAHAALRIA